MARKSFKPEEIQAKLEELRNAGVNATAQDALALLTVEASQAEKPGNDGRTPRGAGRQHHKDGQASGNNEIVVEVHRLVPDGAKTFGFAHCPGQKFGSDSGNDIYFDGRVVEDPAVRNMLLTKGHSAQLLVEIGLNDRGGQEITRLIKVVKRGQPWPERDGGQSGQQRAEQALPQAAPAETKPRQPERANDSQVDVILGTGRDPFYVPESDAARIASAVVAANKKAAESGGVLDVNGKKVRFSLGPGTVIMFNCAQCHSQHRLVWPTLRGLAQSSRVLLCPQCLHGDGQTRSETGQRQQISRKEPIPVKKISPVEEAREQARAILEEKGNTAAACLQAMITLVQAKVVGNEAEAKAKVEAILVEIKAEEEQRQVEEEQHRAEEEAAAARAQAIKEAATILRKSRSQTNMAKALAVLSQAGLELAVIAEVEARVAEMEEEERQQAEKEAAAARKARVVELAEVAVAAAQAEGVEDPENAIATAIATSEIEFDEKIEALTMAQKMWAESQKPPAVEATKPAELAPADSKDARSMPIRPRDDGSQNRILDADSLGTRVLTAMAVPEVLTPTHKALVGYSAEKSLPVGKAEKAIVALGSRRGLGKEASGEEVQRLAEEIIATGDNEQKWLDLLGKKNTAQARAMALFVRLAKALNVQRAEADLAEAEIVEEVPVEVESESKNELLCAHVVASTVREAVERVTTAA